MPASPPAASAPAEPAGPRLHVPRPRWLVLYTGLLVALDAVAVAAATFTAKISWLGLGAEELHIRAWTIPYGALVLVTVPTWLVILALAGAYDLGPFGARPRMWTTVVRAGAQLLAVVAVSYYVLHLAMLGRGVLVGLIPLAVTLTLVERALAGVGLDALRARGLARRTALVLGSRHRVDEFVQRLEIQPQPSLRVVGTHIVDDTGEHRVAAGPPVETGPEVPGPDPLRHARSGDDDAVRERRCIAEALRRTGAETLIVTGGLLQGRLRDIAWMLEGTGVELLVIPAMADVEGMRSEIRPVAGLPLLYVDR